MRKVLTAMAILAACSASYAQEREIRMPSAPSKRVNIAEEDRGSFWCAIELGGGSTVMENKKNVAMIGAAYTAGYRFNQYFRVGAGIGILYYPNSKNVRDTNNHLAMPLFANLRGNILTETIRRVVPYWSVNVGGALPDGFFLSPSVGLRIGERRNAFLVNLGYTLRHMRSYPESITYYSGVLLRLGYEF